MNQHTNIESLKQRQVELSLSLDTYTQSSQHRRVLPLQAAKTTTQENPCQAKYWFQIKSFPLKYKKENA